MHYGATTAPDSHPRANARLAASCEICNGWGSVISQGRHELCLTCQPTADREDRDSVHASRAE